MKTLARLQGFKGWFKIPDKTTFLRASASVFVDLSIVYASFNIIAIAVLKICRSNRHNLGIILIFLHNNVMATHY